MNFKSFEEINKSIDLDKLIEKINKSYSEIESFIDYESYKIKGI